MSRKFPDVYQFLSQPPRVAVFEPIEQPQTDVSSIEKWFTQLYRYNGWKAPLTRCIDGALLHGHAAVEFEYDAATPGNFRFNNIAFADLIFQQDALDLESCEYIAVRKRLSHVQLDELKTLPGANAQEIDKLYKSSNDRTKIQEVFRVYCKHDKLVYSFWYGKACTNFLTRPAPLYVGEVELREAPAQPSIDPMSGMPMMIPQPPSLEYVVEDRYPLDLLAPFTTEEDAIESSLGQAHWTRPAQKAMTSVMSSIVTRTVQAAGLYAAVDASNVPPGTQPNAIKPIQRNHIYDVPIKFTSPDGVDASAVGVLQYIDSAQADENGQTAFAVNNRKDSRRTAEELQQADQQQQLNKSILIDSVAEWLLSTITRAWRVAKSRALAREQTSYPVPADITPELLNATYQLQPAGYSDLIERANLLANLEKYYPIAVQAGIGPSYSARLMKIVFPRENFANEIQTAQQALQVLAAAGAFIQATTTPEEIATLSPEQQQQYTQLLNAIQTTVAGATQPMGGAPSQPGANPAAPQSTEQPAPTN